MPHSRHTPPAATTAASAQPQSAAQKCAALIQSAAVAADGTQKTVVFEYLRDGQLISIAVPILTIVPIPYIQVDEIVIDFSPGISAAAVTASGDPHTASLAAASPAPSPGPTRRTGIDCPQCRYFIEIAIPDILTRTSIQCKKCGLQLTLHRARSQQSLDALLEIERALEQLDSANPCLPPSAP